MHKTSLIPECEYDSQSVKNKLNVCLFLNMQRETYNNINVLKALQINLKAPWRLSQSIQFWTHWTPLSYEYFDKQLQLFQVIMKITKNIMRKLMINVHKSTARNRYLHPHVGKAGL